MPARAARIPLLLAAASLLAACGDSVREDELPQGPVKVESLAILNLPVRDLTPTVQQDILTALAAQLHKRYRVRVAAGQSLGRGVWGDLDRVPADACRHFQTRAAEAAQAYEQLRIGSSIELSEQALGLLSHCGAELTDPDPLIKVYTTYGLGLMSRERKDEAMAAFRTVVAFDPQRPLPTQGLRPSHAQAFETARRQLLSGNPPTVKIQSIPAGATVRVDGRVIGKTPIESAQIFPGRHFVRLELAGHAPWTAELADGVPPARLKTWLHPAYPGEPPRALLDDGLDEDSPSDEAKAQLTALAGHFQVDAVLLVGLKREDGHIRLASLLALPALDFTGAWQTFDLGPKPTGLAKKLRRVAKAYPVLKRKKGKRSKKGKRGKKGE